MKVILFNGSPHEHGAVDTALCEIASQLKKHDIDSEIFWLGTGATHGCIACGGCKETHHCVFDDDHVNRFIDLVNEADGLVLGAPVYYASPAGQAIAFLDRAFHAKKSFSFKVGAAIASCRRSGATATYDCLNKYFTISCMPVVPSNYWNNIHGNSAAEARQDLEGLQTMRVLADNMAWMLKSFAAAKSAGILPPVTEPKITTNLIH